MNRRQFIAVLGSAAAARRPAARAQRLALPVIGLLSSTAADPVSPLITAFRDGIREIGHAESRNVAIEFR